MRIVWAACSVLFSPARVVVCGFCSLVYSLGSLFELVLGLGSWGLGNLGFCWKVLVECSGESTFNASLLRRIQLTQPKKIVTIEKPVEYTYDDGGRALMWQREVWRLSWLLGFWFLLDF